MLGLHLIEDGIFLVGGAVLAVTVPAVGRFVSKQVASAKAEAATKAAAVEAAVKADPAKIDAAIKTYAAQVAKKL
jgi:Na+-transporting methylmalonyl-CoA/oxaloacetate decarboxylase gamma subunit